MEERERECGEASCSSTSSFRFGDLSDNFTLHLLLPLSPLFLSIGSSHLFSRPVFPMTSPGKISKQSGSVLWAGPRLPGRGRWGGGGT